MSVIGHHVQTMKYVKILPEVIDVVVHGDMKKLVQDAKVRQSKSSW